MRKIKIKSPDRQNLVTIETSAVTKGQLIEEINSSDLGISTANINFVDYHSDVTYSLDAAVLPGIDCLLLIVPTKTDQGIDFIDVDNLEEMGYNDLRSYGSKLNKEHSANIDLSGKRSDILEAILDYYDSFEELDDLGTDEEFVYVPFKRSDLVKILNLSPVEYVDGITLQQLEDKHNKVLEENKLKD